MATYKTPGVFIEEIAKLPPSIAEVATAIPAFIGYTQITNKDANGIHPMRISSLLEYETFFGTAAPVNMSIEIKDTVEGTTLKNRSVNAIVYQNFFNTLYYHIVLYFANGGGPCYIVSVGVANNSLSEADMLAGLEAISRFDEPTLLAFPEAVNLPVVQTQEVIDALAAVDAAEESGVPADIVLAYANLAKATVKSKATSLHNVYRAALAQCASLKDRFLIMDCMDDDPEVLRDAAYGIGSDNLRYGAAYHPFLKTGVNYVYNDFSFSVAQLINGTLTFFGAPAYNPNLYDEFIQISRQYATGLYITLPPCSAIAAVYASVDRTRGVWKAPANISLNMVNGVTKRISDEDQENLNIDPVGGKSINAIRTFTGKGTLVWGARTLAGNDNEWRYISVRRFFNMVEESVKKAIESFVFEPNDANTWTKIKAMIENYLVTLWREGALQGAKPEHAFFVSVGLGKTMTPQDILEGRMIVEIGMAAVRPAEFIVLRFSHMMAAS